MVLRTFWKKKNRHTCCSTPSSCIWCTSALHLASCKKDSAWSAASTWSAFANRLRPRHPDLSTPMTCLFPEPKKSSVPWRAQKLTKLECGWGSGRFAVRLISGRAAGPTFQASLEHPVLHTIYELTHSMNELKMHAGMIKKTESKENHVDKKIFRSWTSPNEVHISKTTGR